MALLFFETFPLVINTLLHSFKPFVVADFFNSMFWLLKNSPVWRDVWELALSWWRMNRWFYEFLRRLPSNKCSYTLRIDIPTLLNWNSGHMTHSAEETGDHLLCFAFSTNNLHISMIRQLSFYTRLLKHDGRTF